MEESKVTRIAERVEQPAMHGAAAAKKF